MVCGSGGISREWRGFAGCGIRPFWLFRVRHNARSLANSRRRELSALLRKAQRSFPHGPLATQNLADRPFESCENLAHFCLHLYNVLPVSILDLTR